MPSAKVLEAKKVRVEEITNLLKNSAAGVIVDYKGITVEDDTKLRAELREAGINIPFNRMDVTLLNDSE